MGQSEIAKAEPAELPLSLYQTSVVIKDSGKLRPSPTGFAYVTLVMVTLAVRLAGILQAP
jgi:hypothetical protein